MPEGVKETLCTHCIHREVCAYKQDFLDIIKAVEDITIIKEFPDGTASSKRVTCYDFISGIYVGCKYYFQFIDEVKEKSTRHKQLL